MVYPIIQTPSHNLDNSQNPNTVLLYNNNIIKQNTKKKIDHIITGMRIVSNRNISILLTKSSNYCNEKCAKCGLDICNCKCS